MGETPIQWTDHTWNPAVGCSVKSAGCTNCYAMTMAARIEKMGNAPHYAGLTTPSRAGPVFNGKVAMAPDHIVEAPLRRKKPTKYLVNSMGDVFHENMPDAWIDRIIAVTALCPQHTFQILTKRPDRMRDYMRRRDEQGHHPAFTDAVCMALTGRWNTPELHARDFEALPNVWLGTSVEDQKTADERIPALLDTPAAIRFISYEPALGPISFRWATWDSWKDDHGNQRSSVNEYDGLRMLDWVICGGESGPNARPMHPDWARSVRDQCAEAGVPFLFKQWGEFVEIDGIRCRGNEAGISRQDRGNDVCWLKKDGATVSLSDRLACLESVWGTSCIIKRVGKKAAGRLLDGVEHNGFPEECK